VPELSSGHRAAHAVETDDASCQQRVRFLAVREELSNEWRLNTGLERLSIDTMSQTLTMQERRLKRLVLLDTLDAVGCHRQGDCCCKRKRRSSH
jgi:hypothetical protein